MRMNDAVVRALLENMPNSRWQRQPSIWGSGDGQRGSFGVGHREIESFMKWLTNRGRQPDAQAAPVQPPAQIAPAAQPAAAPALAAAQPLAAPTANDTIEQLAARLYAPPAAQPTAPAPQAQSSQVIPSLPSVGTTPALPPLPSVGATPSVSTGGGASAFVPQNLQPGPSTIGGGASAFVPQNLQPGPSTIPGMAGISGGGQTGIGTTAKPAPSVASPIKPLKPAVR